MSQKAAKKVRRQVAKEAKRNQKVIINNFLRSMAKYNLSDRMYIAWRVIVGKNLSVK